MTKREQLEKAFRGILIDLVINTDVYCNSHNEKEVEKSVKLLLKEVSIRTSLK